ncbi:DNA-directed RNA polymerases I, II, and III subunit RPABC3 [Aphelenchoides besseyi]|nr:DNA-directed RNA polymerases I, II, and III subunit RPABC3 [Aphelenchoides besseyi]KAI6200071.1 DNA-directed RNA polymerases I, II, and III subunit RPABC3 [Aphelenchoides besseyi]KAI6213791.1 DNA-directed RNA polymerases I, II, and III subunit RPABC3 [Aphelenchoides besseyi]KAI6236774.1 DNA-directed RNA polymerases I, II, and III subunit RPABC3 [Aphelenchoides besseyi]
MGSVKALIFDDMFLVKDIDPDGKKFDRVSRLFCNSENFKTEVILDVNTQLYPMNIGEKFRLALAFTLRDDGLADEGEYDQNGQSALMKIFQYIMYGRIYRVEGEESGNEASKMSVYVSFGGLLMRMQGEASVLSGLEVDRNLYLLIKKLAI